MNNIILETKKLSKKFKKQYAANEISISVSKNSIYGLLGPNGVEKTYK